MLQADAYTGFNKLYRDGQITEAACWARARRKIHDVHVRTPSVLTEEILRRIGDLYAIEAEIRGMPIKQRLAERQLKTKLLLKSLKSWLREMMKTLLRHSELAKALTYPLNQCPALTCYADDGWPKQTIISLKMPSVWSVWAVKTSCSSALTTVVSGEVCCTV